MTTPYIPLRTLLEGECTPQVSNGSTELTICEPDEAKATQDHGQQPMTSAQSVSHNHPADTETMTDPARLSGDPVDMTGDDECHSDKCTELRNKPDGTGW